MTQDEDGQEEVQASNENCCVRCRCRRSGIAAKLAMEGHNVTLL